VPPAGDDAQVLKKVAQRGGDRRGLVHNTPGHRAEPPPTQITGVAHLVADGRLAGPAAHGVAARGGLQLGGGAQGARGGDCHGQQGRGGDAHEGHCSTGVKPAGHALG